MRAKRFGETKTLKSTEFTSGDLSQSEGTQKKRASFGSELGDSAQYLGMDAFFNLK